VKGWSGNCGKGGRGGVPPSWKGIGGAERDATRPTFREDPSLNDWQMSDALSLSGRWGTSSLGEFVNFALTVRWRPNASISRDSKWPCRRGKGKG